MIRKTLYVQKPIGWLYHSQKTSPFSAFAWARRCLPIIWAVVLGPIPDGLVEIGWYPLEPTEAGRALMDWPSMVYHFHREGFELPQTATLLATGSSYPNQAFRYGKNAWGVQFHAELTRAMMHRWVVRGAERFTLCGAQQGRDHLDGRMIYDAVLRAWLHRFLATIFRRSCIGLS